MRISSYSTAGYTGTGSPVGTKEELALAIADRLAAQKKKKHAAGMQKSEKKLYQKKVNYNSREIRSALIKASKAQGAGMVLTSAKAKLTSLLKCKGTGQYDENELNAAIIHARRMVRCAQMKVRNLQKEEQQKSRIEHKVEQEKLERELKKLQLEGRERTQLLELARQRRINRLKEKSKMDEADKEYESRQCQNQQSGDRVTFQNTGISSGTAEVLLELSNQGIQLSEEQLEALMMEAAMAEAGMVSGTGMGAAPVDAAVPMPDSLPL